MVTQGNVQCPACVFEVCMSNMDQWIGNADKMFTEKELKQILEMEFGNVLSNMKLPQEKGDCKGIEEDVEVSSLVRSRKLTVLQVVQWPRAKELSKIPSTWVRANDIEMETRLLHNVRWSHFQTFTKRKKYKIIQNASDRILTQVF